MRIFDVAGTHSRPMSGGGIEPDLSRIGTHHRRGGRRGLRDQPIQLDVAQLVNGYLQAVPCESLLTNRGAVLAENLHAEETQDYERGEQRRPAQRGREHEGGADIAHQHHGRGTKVLPERWPYRSLAVGGHRNRGEACRKEVGQCAGHTDENDRLDGEDVRPLQRRRVQMHCRHDRAPDQGLDRRDRRVEHDLQHRQPKDDRHEGDSHGHRKDEMGRRNEQQPKHERGLAPAVRVSAGAPPDPDPGRLTDDRQCERDSPAPQRRRRFDPDERTADEHGQRTERPHGQDEAADGVLPRALGHRWNPPPENDL